LHPLPPGLKEGNCVFKRRKGKKGNEKYRERKNEKEEV
jgi:hypothetical protein